MKLISPQLQDSNRLNQRIALLGPWLVFLCIGGAIATIFSVVSTQGAGVSSGFTDNLFYCDNSNKIRYKYSDDSFEDRSPYWDGNLFLSVTMGFHGLSFPLAETIDILFDLVFGRGSQILVGLATYPILRRSVLRSMEVRDFSLALLLPFFLERISANTLWAMLANLRVVRRKEPRPEGQSSRSGLRIGWRMILTILVGCYILALPTFLSAMTSYQALGGPFIPTDDGGSSYMSTENLTIPDYVLIRGERFGLPDYLPLSNTTADHQLYAAFAGYNEGLSQAEEIWIGNWRLNVSYPVNPFEWSDTEQAFNHTRDALPDQQNVTDPNTPSLWSFNLWPHNATWDNWRSLQYPYGTGNSRMTSSIVVRNTTYQLDEPIYLLVNSPYGGSSSSTYYQYSDNKTASGDELASIGKCLPSEHYIWGFSSLMLFTFCMITVVVLLFLMALHYDAYFNSMADRYKLEISPYRDVLDLADELRAHYGEAEAAIMSASALDRFMQTDPATANLETRTMHRSRRAKWKQGKQYPRIPTWMDIRSRSMMAGTNSADAEQSLIAIGLDTQGSELEMAQMPAKAVTRQDSRE